jgi:hypothetical protein
VIEVWLARSGSKAYDANGLCWAAVSCMVELDSGSGWLYSLGLAAEEPDHSASTVPGRIDYRPRASGWRSLAFWRKAR